MNILYNPENELFFKEAQEVATYSTCKNRKCGAIIIKQGEIIGRGFNSPPGNLESQRRCSIDKNSLDEKVTDKTCCIHAEVRAILDALMNHDLTGATIYFTSVNEKGERLPSERPYCTSCSKLALDMGISKWVLEHGEKFIEYDSQEYNDISFDYHR